MNYIIVSTWAGNDEKDALEHLTRLVNEQLGAGYRPVGGVSLIWQPGNQVHRSYFVASQAMLRETDLGKSYSRVIAGTTIVSQPGELQGRD